MVVHYGPGRIESQRKCRCNPEVPLQRMHKGCAAAAVIAAEIRIGGQRNSAQRGKGDEVGVLEFRRDRIGQKEKSSPASK
jgi:hypothetical protein